MIPFLLLLPGVLAYVPLDVIHVWYGLPFLLCPAFLLGYGLTSIENYYGRRIILIRALTILILVSCAINAHHFARHALAFQHVNAGVADRIAASTAQDSTLVAGPRLGLSGLGPTLGRYVVATTGHPVSSPVGDISCAELETALHSSSKLLIVSYESRCGSLSHPDVSLRRYFQYLDLSTFEITVDSVRADLLFHNPAAGPIRQ
jgi:hypothetical protein